MSAALAATHAAAGVRSVDLTEPVLHRVVEAGTELISELVGVGPALLLELVADLSAKFVADSPALISLFLGADRVRDRRRRLGEGEAGWDQDRQADGAGHEPFMKCAHYEYLLLGDKLRMRLADEAPGAATVKLR
jgi:hypothetical protein